jgi:hypothetical protein
MNHFDGLSACRGIAKSHDHKERLRVFRQIDQREGKGKKYDDSPYSSGHKEDQKPQSGQFSPLSVAMTMDVAVQSEPGDL